MNYRYRLWGINWLPLLGFAVCTMGLWGYLKYYDIAAIEELKNFEWKIAVQVVGWLVLWRALFCGWFKIRFGFYVLWSLIVLSEMGESVYRHDGLRFLFSLFLGIFLYGCYQWIESLLDQARVNPKLQWFEGKLAQIPKITVQFQLPGHEFKEAGLRALDEQGAFVLFGHLDAPIFRKTRLKLRLNYRSSEVTVEALPVAKLDWEEAGFGLQFFFDDLYHQTQYTKLVQQLKGEGLA